MHIVILGGNGGIGAALTAHYLHLQAQVSVFSRAALADTSLPGLQHFLYQPEMLEQPQSPLHEALKTVFSQPVDLVFCCLGFAASGPAAAGKKYPSAQRGWFTSSIRSEYGITSVVAAGSLAMAEQVTTSEVMLVVSEGWQYHRQSGRRLA